MDDDGLMEVEGVMVGSKLGHFDRDPSLWTLISA